MGAYLDKPVTAKRSSRGRATVGSAAGGREIVYASTAMQGWRINMEDAHVVVPDFDKSTALFAVFDGHGGREVAEYCAQAMPEMLQSNEAYKSGDLVAGLQQLFLDTDRRLLDKEVVMELKKLVGGGAGEIEQDSGAEGEDEEEEAVTLMEEANMPLESLLAKYVTSGDAGRNDCKQQQQQQQQTESIKEGGEGGERGGERSNGDKVKSMLQALVSGAGFEIEFEDSDSEWTEEEEEEGDEEDEEGDEEDGGKGDKEAEGVMVEKEDTVDKEKKSSIEKLEQSSQNLDEDSSGTPTNILTPLSPPTPPPSLPSPNSTLAKPTTEPKVNGIATKASSDEENKSPCAKSPCANSPYDKSPSDKSPCAKVESSEDTNSTKTHTLLDLLTSAVTETQNHQVKKVSERENRKRKREEGVPPIKKEKKFCRGILDEEGYHSGTTAVLCLLRPDSLTVANAGDSRCVLSSAGKAVDMSEDHKPTDEAELSRIQRAGGSVGADGRVNGGLNLSRAIGDHFYKENPSLPLEEQMITALPDVKSRLLTAEDEFFIVACDGIWNMKSSQEVVDFIHSRLRDGVKEKETKSLDRLLQSICEELCDDCLAADTDNDGTGCDNMTVAIILLSPHRHSLPPSSSPPPPPLPSNLHSPPSLPTTS